MLGLLWDAFQQTQQGELEDKLDRLQDETAETEGAQRQVLLLGAKVDRLALICRAMFELMQESGGASEDRLKAKITEIDLRDGTQDDRMTAKPKKCPKCDAMISPQFGRCLFCGYKDETRDPFL
ncbi:MAG: hypothetical protein ACM3SQ_18525 [Betaproteobacteria bacterium]